MRSTDVMFILAYRDVQSKQIANNYIVRRTAADFGIPMFTNIQVAKMFVEAIHMYRNGKVSTFPHSFVL
jgi:hypothetical protein